MYRMVTDYLHLPHSDSKSRPSHVGPGTVQTKLRQEYDMNNIQFEYITAYEH